MLSTNPATQLLHPEAAVLSIGLLAFDDMQALDLAGPLGVFGSANAQPRAGLPAYRLHVIGLSTGSVKAENGLTFLPGCDIHDTPPLDTLLIPGGVGSRQTLSRNDELLEWLRSRAQETRRMVAICTGVFTLAATGLLDGRRATTHWRFREEFNQRFPRVILDVDPLFLRDGHFYTSGGLTAGMDLALSLVEADLGREVALGVARDLVMYLVRPGNQAQFSAPLDAQTRGEGRFAQFVDWLVAHMHEDLDTERLAERVAMSARNFRRVFHQRFGCTPARYLERLRLERACALLVTGSDGIDRIAHACGFASADALRRAFRARYGASPGEYRQRFAPPRVAGID